MLLSSTETFLAKKGIMDQILEQRWLPLLTRPWYTHLAAIALALVFIVNPNIEAVSRPNVMRIAFGFVSLHVILSGGVAYYALSKTLKQIEKLLSSPILAQGSSENAEEFKSLKSKLTRLRWSVRFNLPFLCIFIPVFVVFNVLEIPEVYFGLNIILSVLVLISLSLIYQLMSPNNSRRSSGNSTTVTEYNSQPKPRAVDI